MNTINAKRFGFSQSERSPISLVYSVIMCVLEDKKGTKVYLEVRISNTGCVFWNFLCYFERSIFWSKQ